MQRILILLAGLSVSNIVITANKPAVITSPKAKTSHNKAAHKPANSWEKLEERVLAVFTPEQKKSWHQNKLLWESKVSQHKAAKKQQVTNHPNPAAQEPTSSKALKKQVRKGLPSTEHAMWDLYIALRRLWRQANGYTKTPSKKTDQKTSVSKTKIQAKN